MQGSVMPRYFINTFNHFDAIDEEGTVLPDSGALRGLLRKALTEILRDEGEERGVDEFAAEALDESGRRVMRARIRFTVTDGDGSGTPDPGRVQDPAEQS
jgi:hypothetical protein